MKINYYDREIQAQILSKLQDQKGVYLKDESAALFSSSDDAQRTCDHLNYLLNIDDDALLAFTSKKSENLADMYYCQGKRFEDEFYNIVLDSDATLRLKYTKNRITCLVENQAHYDLFEKAQEKEEKKLLLNTFFSNDRLSNFEKNVFEALKEKLMEEPFSKKTIIFPMKNLLPLKVFQSEYWDILIDWPETEALHKAHEYALKLINILNQHPDNIVGCSVADATDKNGWEDYVYYSHSGKKYTLRKLSRDNEECNGAQYLFEVPVNSQIFFQLAFLVLNPEN